MPHSAWSAVTNLGNAGLLLPAAAVISALLLAARAWRLAGWWSLGFALAVGLVVASKVAFLGWGIGIRALDFTGVSGHAMLAAAVLPVLGFLLTRDRGGVSALAISCGVALGVAVGWSRWVLGMHSLSEVLAGLALGALVAAAFVRQARRTGGPVLHAWVLAALLLLDAAIHYGYDHKATGHDIVVNLALQVSGRDRPYSRAEWHAGDRRQRLD
jgi:membrane-associated phospholipid phosphatase